MQNVLSVANIIRDYYISLEELNQILKYPTSGADFKKNYSI
jgi:hypothetical protein